MRQLNLPPLAEPHRADETKTTADKGSAIIVQSRRINAPRDAVWNAWTDPAQLGQWWGPKDFSITTKLFEFRVGGTWALTMHGPGERDFPNHIVFDAIDKTAAVWRIVYHHVSTDGVAPMHFETVVTFEELLIDGKKATRLIMRADFGKESFRDQLIRDHGVALGGRETLARLADHTEGSGYLRTQLASGFALTMIRELPVARDLVWRAWTEPVLLTQWFCPRPWSATNFDLDLRAGGRNNNSMEGPGPDGKPLRMTNTGSYLEVVVGQKLVFTDLLVEEWAPNQQAFLGFTATLLFEDAGSGKTRYTAICKHLTEAKRHEHANMGFFDGWGIATDQLVALLTSKNRAQA